MKFFEENYSHELPTRIKNLRKKHNITQSELSNAGQVSQVEKEKQQVTTSILLYLNTQTDLDYKEIIFGDIAKLVENMFYHCFGSILLWLQASFSRREKQENHQLCWWLTRLLASIYFSKYNLIVQVR